jgi:FkbM family methyltransferase
VKNALFGDPDQFLGQCKGVIHVGANDGAERDLYARYSLPVLWVEALPDMFNTLAQNLRNYPRQRAVNALVTDKEGETYDFHVSSNSGASSSIYELKGHKELWPDVAVTSTIQLRSITLPTLLRDEGTSPSEFDALILDVQGAELLVIAGAGQVLDSVRFVKAEAADFEAYQGACTVSTLSQALEARGFVVRRKERFARKEGIGSYYDILFERSAKDSQLPAGKAPSSG